MFKKLKNYFENKNQKEAKPVTKDVFEKINDLFSSLDEDIICFRLGLDITPNIDVILNTMESERDRIANLTGFILPPVRFIEDDNIQENSFNVYINGKFAEEKFIIPTIENIEEELINSIDNILNNNLKEIFSNETVEKYISEVRNKNSKLTADLCNWLSTVEIKYILVNILNNKKSIKNISYIFEKISEQIFIENMYEKNDIEKISLAMIDRI